MPDFQYYDLVKKILMSPAVKREDGVAACDALNAQFIEIQRLNTRVQILEAQVKDAR